jgi:hypothetical protein
VSSPVNEARPDAGEPVDDRAEELDDPRPAPPAQEPGRETGATASERASAQTAAELSDR